MSIITKSNNVLNSVGFGTIKKLNTTPKTIFNAYKSRVLADGGVVKDEARTLQAIEMLYATGLYGTMNTAVSGTFGVKVDGNGGIVKLYAIDGFDMLGVVFGTGILPKLDADNNIDFNANNASDNANGGMFTSTSKQVLSQGNFGMHLYIKNSDLTSAYQMLQCTKHNDVPNTQIILGMITFNNGELAMYAQNNSLVLTGSASHTIARANMRLYEFPPINFILDFSNKIIVGNRNSIEMTTPVYDTIKEYKTQDFYLDFGGAYRSDKKYFGRGVVRDMFCFAHATREQATLLSAFS